MNYPPFAANRRIRSAASKSPSMQHGERNSAVAILQGALIDLGYSMPRSTNKAGQPDGIYGDETQAKVRQFQAEKKLLPDGVAGHDTFALLDALMVAKKGPPKPIPGLPVPLNPSPIAADRNYRLGVGDPTIKPDFGSGAFDSEPTEMSMWALKQTILEILPPRGASATVFIGDDAAKNMKHYLDASGIRLRLDLEGMLGSGPTAMARFKNEVQQALLFVERLPLGSHKITSMTAESAYNFKNESKNWYYAVGGYSTWGVGRAMVRNGQAGKEFELLFEYKFFDRYNWDKGKSVTIGGIEITDKFMGEFHRQGLAREYDMIGSLTRTFRWKHGDKIPDAQYAHGGSR